MKLKTLLQLLVLASGSIVQAIDVLTVPEYSDVVMLDTETLHGIASFESGIALIGPASTLNINLMGAPLSNKLDLNGGTVCLDADLRCASSFFFPSSGNIDGKGYTIIGDGDLSIDGTITIVSDVTIDGQGHNLDVSATGKILVADGVTLTLSNMVVDNCKSADFASCLGMESQIVLDRVQLCLSNDFCLDNGSLLIHEAFLKGTHRFVFASKQSSFISEHGLLSVNDGATIHFDGFALAENRSLLSGTSDNSVLYLNSATLSSDAPALIFDQGTLAVANDVTFNIAGQTSTDGMALYSVDRSREATLKILAAANVNLKGYLKAD